MRCHSCNIGEFDLFGESSDIQKGYCYECREVMKYENFGAVRR